MRRLKHRKTRSLRLAAQLKSSLRAPAGSAHGWPPEGTGISEPAPGGKAQCLGKWCGAWVSVGKVGFAILGKQNHTGKPAGPGKSPLQTVTAGQLGAAESASCLSWSGLQSYGQAPGLCTGLDKARPAPLVVLGSASSLSEPLGISRQSCARGL